MSFRTLGKWALTKNLKILRYAKYIHIFLCDLTLEGASSRKIMIPLVMAEQNLRS